MKVTRRQLELLVKEATASGGKSVLTEAELNEISGLISAMARGLGKSVTKTFAKVLEKGVKGVGEYLAKNPEKIANIMALAKQSADKLPGIQKMLDDLGADAEDPAKLAMALANPPKEAEADLTKMYQGASDQLEKAEDCECPDPEEEKSVMSKLGSSIAKFFS